MDPDEKRSHVTSPGHTLCGIVRNHESSMIEDGDNESTMLHFGANPFIHEGRLRPHLTLSLAKEGEISANAKRRRIADAPAGWRASMDDCDERFDTQLSVGRDDCVTVCKRPPPALHWFPGCCSGMTLHVLCRQA